MLAVLMGILLIEPAALAMSQRQFEITICRGIPGGSREKGELEVLSRPQIVTRHNQQALISVGQQVPITTDISKQGDKEIHTISRIQVGMILKLTPKIQDDGSVFVKGEFSISEVISPTSTSSRIMTFHQVLQSGQDHFIPFYHTKGIEPIKPSSGNEMWMTIKVVSPQVNPKVLQAIPEPVPLLGKSK